LRHRVHFSGRRALALRGPSERAAPIASVFGQRVSITPVAPLLIAFAVRAAYPTRMVTVTALASAGQFIVTLTDAALLPRRSSCASPDWRSSIFLRHAVTLAGVPLLMVLALVSAGSSRSRSGRLGGGRGHTAAAGSRLFDVPRFDRAERAVLM
jgi:hypothetical protein